MESNYSNNSQIIQVKVPILRGECLETGITFDISLNRDNGYKSGLIIKQILDYNYYLKPKMIFLKIFKNTFETTYNKLNSDLENDICSYIKSLDFPCVY